MTEFYLGQEFYFSERENKLVDPTRGGGVMIRPTKSGGYSPNLLFPILSGKSSENIKMTSTVASQIVWAGTKEAEWEQYPKDDVAIRSKGSSKVWIVLREERLYFDEVRSVISFYPNWEARIANPVSVRTTRQTEQRRDCCLLFHRGGSPSPQRRIEIPERGNFVTSKTELESTQDLYELLIKDPHVMGIYNDIPEKLVASRAKILLERIQIIAEQREENLQSTPYNLKLAEDAFSRSVETRVETRVETTTGYAW